MVRTTPNRFTHFQEFYIQKNNEEVAYFFSGKKKDLVKVLKQGDTDQALNIINEQRLKIKSREDLIILVNELNKE